MTFEVVYNTALKVFSQLYVGITAPTGKEGAPLAFATPYEENAAGRKRQDTVDTWLQSKRRPKIKNGRYEYDEAGRIQYDDDDSTTRIVQNVPRSGFRISDDVKRVYWGGGNVVWRVEDPDGWEVEIQSNNLMALIRSVGIQPGGEINGKLIWAREGANNILIPETSEEYKNAVKAFETVKPPSKIPMKDRVIGRMYRLQDGSFAQYLGKVWVTDVHPDADQLYSEAKIRGAGGTYKLNYHPQTILNGEQKQVEALLIPESKTDYGWATAAYVKIFKSTAPLVAELDQETISPVAALKIMHSHKLEYSSTAAQDIPVYVSQERPGTVRLVFDQMSDRQFAAHLKEVKKTLAEHRKHSYTDKNHPPSMSVILPRHALSNPEHIALMVDGELQYDATQVMTNSNSTWFVAAGKLIVKGDHIDRVLPDQYNNRYSYGYSMGVPTNSEIDNLCCTLPRFKTDDELLEFMKQEHAAGRFMVGTFKEI